MTTYFLQMHPFIRCNATITRMDGSTVYTVRYAFSLSGRTLAILDADNQIVGKIRQAISPITPKFRIALNEEPPFYLQRRFSLRPGYKITGNAYSITMNDARAGRRVYCVVTDKYGKSVKSNVVTLSKR